MSTETDARAVELRSEGKSFAVIARELDLDRPSAAIDAFTRSLQRRPDAEQHRLLGEELARLEILESSIRRSTRLDTTETDRRLHAVAQIRAHVSSAVSAVGAEESPVGPDRSE